jgi:DNA polymerase V
MPGKDFRFGISGGVSGVDVNQLVVRHPLSTYFMRVAADVPELDVRAEDILVIDRSLNPKINDIIVVTEPDSPELKIVQYTKEHLRAELWGVAVHIIRNLRP